MVHHLSIRSGSLRNLALLFSFRVKTLFNIPEKFPVQEQVDDEQGRKDKT